MSAKQGERPHWSLLVGGVRIHWAGREHYSHASGSLIETQQKIEKF